jgi:hypothetical protein
LLLILVAPFGDLGFVLSDARVVDFWFVVFDGISHGGASALWSSVANVTWRWM